MSETINPNEQLITAANDVLKTIDRDREREVIERRFGLRGTKETLEQVGESMSITRERVRQIEKATLIRAKLQLEKSENENFAKAEISLVQFLAKHGRVTQLDVMAGELLGKGERERGVVSFLAEMSSKMLTTTENDHYFQAVALADRGDEKTIKKAVDELVAKLREHKDPVTPEELFPLIAASKLAKYETAEEATAMASVSKLVASLNGLWGLTKNPAVNPKNIRDKIYIVLKNNHGKSMHFSEIAAAVKSADFKRNKITDQAIHNELIKDSRFVLIGRGIYALAEWGYKKGSITDIIAQILRDNKAPMNREDIVREVLKVREVRETTILLYLQSKPQFKRVAKGEYTLADNK